MLGIWTAIRRSLRMRIMLSAGIGLTGLLVIMALQGAQILGASTRQLMAEWRSTAEHSADHVQARIEQDMNAVRDAARRLGALQASDAGSAAAILDQALERLTVFTRGLLWLGPDGSLQAAAPPHPSAALELLPVDWNPGPGEGSCGESLSGLARTAQAAPVVAFEVCTGRSGKVLAVADLQDGALSDFLPRTAKGGHAALIDGGGWVLVATDPSLLYSRREHPEWVARARLAGGSTVGETNGSDNRDIMAFSPVGTTGWGVVLGEPVSHALAATITLRRRMLLLGLAAVLLVMGYAWWDTGAVTRPLRRLQALAERMAAGDLEVPVDIHRQDEVGALARSFEAMRVHLRTSREQIEHALAETRRREQEAGVLYAASQEILRPSHDGGALRTIVERARELLGGTAAAICLAEYPGGPLRPVAAAGLQNFAPASAASGLACLAVPGAPGTGCPLAGLAGRSDLALSPLSGEGVVGGHLCMARPAGQPLAEPDRTLLSGLADLAALALAHEQLQTQARRLAVYAERERISRELHDSVSQSISYLYSQLALLQELLPRLSADQLRTELAALAGVASAAFEECRTSIFSLRAGSGAQVPLPTVIAGCVRDFTARTGLEVDLDTAAMAQISLPAEAEVQLVRVVQEALSNVARHARANRVAVSAAVVDGSLRVSIQDDGIGFDPGAPRAGGRSFGLEMMRERVASVGGTMEIDSHKGSGTRVRVHLPLDHKEVLSHADDPGAPRR